jgi:hypothetical protein
MNGTRDCFVAFALYEVADAFLKHTKGAEELLVLSSAVAMDR